MHQFRSDPKLRERERERDKNNYIFYKYSVFFFFCKSGYSYEHYELNTKPPMNLTNTL